MRDQNKTPFLTALIEYVKSNPTPFDVPGHKLGSFETDFSRFLSKEAYLYDANAPLGLDNLYHSTGVIYEAEQLASDAMQSDCTLFSVNGTTGGILTMITALLDVKDKIIVPRNVHKSIINALIISGAIPIFVDPFIDNELNIACSVSVENYILAMDKNPTAKAVFVINPTYFGCVSDLKTIVKEAHKRDMLVLVDEAHGSNFYFSDELPLSAMECDADISAVSFHKGSGSLTQSSMILIKGERVNLYEVKRAFAMFQSTSPYHLLLASLDAARKEMALHGKELIHENLKMAEYARSELNKIPGIAVYGSEYIEKANTSAVYSIDLTKLVIDVRGLGIYGYDAYKELRKESNIQLELGEVSVVLALIGPGTTYEHIDKLIIAFKKLSEKYSKNVNRITLPTYHYSYPSMVVSPRDAYEAPHTVVKIKDSIGEISAETVMAYPPGIPLVIPGEIITDNCTKLISFYKREGGVVLKDTAEDEIKIINRKEWYLSEDMPFNK